MQSTQQLQYDEFLELKTDFVTVVEALSVLHDFIESVFGDKYESYQKCQPGARISSTLASSPRAALRNLRWKHMNTSNTSSFSPPAPKGGSQAHQTSPSSSSLPTSHSSNLYNHLERGGKEDVSPPDESMKRLPMVGKSEVVEVKLELDEDVPDFLDDVDPFCSSSAYDTPESSEMNLVSPYHAHHTLHHQLDTPSTSTSSGSGVTYPSQLTPSSSSSSSKTSPHACQPSRYIPGLIPIQSESTLVQQQDSSSATGKSFLEDPAADSVTSSSDSEDDDWQPSSSSSATISQKFCNKKDSQKRKRKSAKSGASSLPGSLQRRPPPPPPGGVTAMVTGEDGPFKCSMCPASYRQEDSLRSHQKYKHNPSRVQCECHLCGKSMVDKYRLQRHLRLHTGEKPFECQFCGQSFYRKDYHTKHLQRKHGIPYTGGATPAVSSNLPPTTTSKKKCYIKSPSSSSKVHLPAHSPRNQRITETPPIIKQEPPVTPPPRLGSSSMDTSLSSPSTMLSSAGKDQSSFIMDYFPSSGDTEGAGESHHHHHHQPQLSNAGPSIISTSSLMTMASLTFDDLISADL